MANLSSDTSNKHQMLLKLEEKGFISRVPGQARSLKLLLDRDEIPRLQRPK